MKIRLIGRIGLICSMFYVLCSMFLGEVRAVETGQFVETGRAPSLRFLHTDHLGSMSAVSDERGGKVDEGRYSPYGELNKTYKTYRTYTSYRFTGQEEDSETGLYNYNARLYNPQTGQFVAADKLAGRSGRDGARPVSTVSTSLNRFAYALNNPLNFIDPSGRQADPYQAAGFNFRQYPSSSEADIAKTRLIIEQAMSVIEPGVLEVVRGGYLSGGLQITQSYIILEPEINITGRSYIVGSYGFHKIYNQQNQLQSIEPYLVFSPLLLSTARPEHWARHEVGHLYDELRGDLSASEQFQQALQQGYAYAGLPFSTTFSYNFLDVLRYFGRTYALTYRAVEEEFSHELFAEAFAFFEESNPLMGYALKLVDYFNQLLGVSKVFAPRALPAPLELIKNYQRWQEARGRLEGVMWQ